MYKLVYMYMMHTVYGIYLANNKFGELGRNTHWQIFSLANRAILSVNCFMVLHNTCD